MIEILIEHEQTIRVSVFIGLLVLLSCAEFFIPLAKRQTVRLRQWFTNLAIVVIDTLTLRLIFPLLAVGTATYADQQGYGLFNIVDLNYWATFIISLLALDLLIYGQHVMMHNIPMLWRLHRMHHTELSLDTTSAVRFHPLEIVLSMLIKMLFVLIMGVPAAAVILFEILLNGLALLNHSNIKLPGLIERFLRLIIITPEVHWIHHSEINAETNSNYGFNLCLWDRLFSTYIDKPTKDYPDMRQGLREFGFEKSLSLPELIISPFKEYPDQKDMNEK